MQSSWKLHEKQFDSVQRAECKKKKFNNLNNTETMAFLQPMDSLQKLFLLDFKGGDHGRETPTPGLGSLHLPPPPPAHSDILFISF